MESGLRVSTDYQSQPVWQRKQQELDIIRDVRVIDNIVQIKAKGTDELSLLIKSPYSKQPQFGYPNILYDTGDRSLLPLSPDDKGQSPYWGFLTKNLIAGEVNMNINELVKVFKHE